jgi:hypothetical protein
MAAPRFVWIIRTWCNLDTYWEHVREHKEFDFAYVKPEMLLGEIDRIILKEQTEWEDLSKSSGLSRSDREFEVDKPSLDQLKSRPFFKFLTISSSGNSSDDFMQSWYVERMKVIDSL